MLSIIIPTWQEAASIADAVAEARAIGDEVIVVDGGSPDGTASLAAHAGACVVTASKGRGVQLHAGAHAAGGDVLLFLHADARLPHAARGAIEQALREPQLQAGNFRLRFIPDSRIARALSMCNDLRRRLLRIYYGDSALFVRAAAYRRLGGFQPWTIMEDYEFIRRLERCSRTAYIRDVEVLVDARRFEARPLDALFRWALIQGLYSAGVPADALAHIYRDIRRALH
jgi:rSAM/selenodomain-associated transferase 2